MKGILKGFKKFVNKEHELEIGHPTDVRHVAHIGWEGTSASPPSWMREFQTAPEFSSSSLSSIAQSGDQWSSQEIQQSMGLETSEKGGDSLPKGRKKTKRKKTKVTSPSSSRSPSGILKSKASYNVAKTEVGVENQIQVS